MNSGPGNAGPGNAGRPPMMDLWQETLPVRFGGVDRSGRLTLAATFGLFQEAAINHAENLGAGRAVLREKRQGWVLSRMSVVLDARPAWTDPITVRSWPRGAERLFAVRDYDIRDGAGNALVRGRSLWLVIDLDKLKPLRIQPVIEDMPTNEGRDAMGEFPQALTMPPDLAKAGERRARYSDIDYNGHMNNVRYVSWIEDIAREGLLETARRIRFDINYISEVKEGDLVEIRSGPAKRPPSCGGDDAWEEETALEGLRGGEAVFRAELRTIG